MVTEDIISPIEIAKYFLIRAKEDGEIITPLKMQKLVYFAYVFYLLKQRGKDRLFNESIEAWPAGPVVPSLYRVLKKYGSSPIDIEKFVNVSKESFLEKYGKKVIEMLDNVYEMCEKFTAFELVVATHRERAWLEARKGLALNEKSNKSILNEHILGQHLK